METRRATVIGNVCPFVAVGGSDEHENCPAARRRGDRRGRRLRGIRGRRRRHDRRSWSRTASRSRSSATPTRSASASGSTSRSTRTATASATASRMDIIRPAATADGLEVPVVMDASPYYTTLGRGNESRADPGRRQRRAERQVAAVLRQLLRPARLRRRAAAHGRHRLLERLPDHRRHARQPEREARHRLAQRPRARLRQGREPRHRRLAQRQDRHDRQVVRRHAGERDRRHRRRRACRRSCRSRRSRAGTTTCARTGSG